MLNMQNGAIGAWRPSFWAREARGPVRARYLKKRAASFLTGESLEQKCENLLLMCAQWTNLGGVIFHFLKNVCKIFGESGARTLRAGWTQAVRKPCANRAQTVRKPCANRAQISQATPQATVGPKMHFWEKNLRVPDRSIGFIWTPPTAELSQKMFSETAAARERPCASRAQAVSQCVFNASSMRLQCVFNASSRRLQGAFKVGGGGLQRTGLLTCADAAVDRRHCAGWGSAP